MASTNWLTAVFFKHSGYCICVTKSYFQEDVIREVNEIQSYYQLTGDVQQVSWSSMFKSVNYRRQLLVVVMVFLQGETKSQMNCD